MIIKAPDQGKNGENTPNNKIRSFSKEEIDLMAKTLVEIAFYQANGKLSKKQETAAMDNLS